jgi:hypothetical protein
MLKLDFWEPRGCIMTKWKLAGGTAVIALVSVQTAFADVTPEDVWQNVQDLYTSTGNSVITASAARDGDTLVVTGLKVITDNEMSKGESFIAEMRFRDLGDGTVEITTSEEMTVTSTSPGIEGAAPTTVDGTVKLPGMVAIASGTPEETGYAFTVPSLTMDLNTTGGDQGTGKITIAMSDAAMNYLISGPEDAPMLDGGFSAVTTSMAFEGSSETGPVMGSLSMADLTGTAKGTFAGLEDGEAADALAKGFAVDTSFGYGAVNYDFDITDESGPAKLIGGSEGGSMQFAMDAARMMLDSSGKNSSLTFSGAQIPFPEVKLSYAESAFNFLMPLAKSDTPVDFTALAKVVDLAVSEEIWGMFDPTGAIPHDPATLIIDAKGKARVLTDVMDNAANEAMDGASPFELHALDLTEIRAKIAGAELTGNGALTFDNTDLETYGGVPTPTGKIDLRLIGGNTLLDKLVGMGMMTDEDAMGARMMMSMFANPGAAADELTSTLEFKDKHFFANGQQLQ